MWMIQSLFHILFPSQCIGCGKNHRPICDHCIRLSRKSLGVPVPYITSAFDFRDPVIKKAIHAIKYYHRKDLVAPLAFLLAENLRQIPLIETFILIPVPMLRSRKLFRGYNQAELIALELSKLLGLPVRTDLLYRTKSTVRQATIRTKQERVENQRGVFSAKEDLTGKNFLIIDDVTTTGATLSEARKILLKHGAAQVLAATLAH